MIASSRRVRKLEAQISVLEVELAKTREEMYANLERSMSHAERMAEAQTMVLRRLIRDLVGGKPNIDRFLDVLEDHAALFEAGPLEGDMDKVQAGARPQRGDLGDPLPEGTEIKRVTEDAYAKERP